jgi:uncharacterized protein (TIGR03067 family)
LLAALLVPRVAGSAEPDPEPPSRPQDELRRWAGTYAVVHFERNGRKASEAELKTMKVTLQGTDGTFHVGDLITRSRVTVFPNKRPREVDCFYLSGPVKGQTVKGIYKIEGGKVTCCYAEIGKERPREFTSKPGSGHTLYVVERIKEK